MILNFLRKHEKTVGLVIAITTFGLALLAGATPLAAIATTLILTFLITTTLKKIVKNNPTTPSSSISRREPSNAPPEIALPRVNKPSTPFTQPTPLEKQEIQLLQAINRKTQEALVQQETKRKAQQQKIQEFREKYAAQQKDFENKKEETIRKKQAEHKNKIEQCAPEKRSALIQACNEEIIQITATLDRLLTAKKASDEKMILAQVEAYEAQESIASSMEVVKKYNGQPTS